MRHFNFLRCKKDCSGFTRGKDYPMTLESVRLSHGERRSRRNGVRESVTLAGRGLMIVLKADNGWRHRFLDRPQAEHPIIHNFGFLVEHFTIPQIPDVARLNPKAFETYKARLRALES
jgi:hypothetical protein